MRRNINISYLKENNNYVFCPL